MFTMQTAPPPRVLSVDILRGLTIALMIVVNDAGDGTHVWWPLGHAAWSGWTLTDLVFPTFLFLVGCSIVFSLAGRIARGANRQQLALHILRRSFIILLLGWCINLMPYFHLSTLRFYGVLPRIAICYLITALLFLRVQRPRTLALLSAALLIGYWLLLRFVPIPGAGTPTHQIPLLDHDQNLVAWLDRHIVAFVQRYLHTGHLYETVRDPEGFLSTLPAIATTLFGLLTGLWMRRASTLSPQPVTTPLQPPPNTITPVQCLTGLLTSGLLSLTAGYLWSPWFPFNKKLWTSSYVLLAAGWALLALGLLYWLLDLRQVQRKSRLAAALIWPWQVFGSNAIAAYVISESVIPYLAIIPVGTIPTTGKPLSLLGWIYLHCFAFHGSTDLTSHLFALAYTAFCFLPIWYLWHKRIFLKV